MSQSPSQRAADFADRLEQINAELIATVEGCSDTEWTTACDGEAWPVGVTAHHVATAYDGFKSIIGDLANGKTMPNFTMAMLDQVNAEHAKEFARCTQADTAALLRSNGAAMAATLRGFSDEQMDRSAPLALAGGNVVSAAQMAEALIGHPTGHLASIRAALGR